MFESCLKKQAEVIQLFADCLSQEDKYKKIIELGREQKPISPEFKIPENIVAGCQSTVYIHSSFVEGKVVFEAEADALISAGLAALLVKVYSYETPEVMLTCPPSHLEELGISASLTPSRSNGLYSMHLRMKQEALKWILPKS